jgi:hypothetical protein
MFAARTAVRGALQTRAFSASARDVRCPEELVDAVRGGQKLQLEAEIWMDHDFGVAIHKGDNC